jgi:hypothetical protein
MDVSTVRVLNVTNWLTTTMVTSLFTSQKIMKTTRKIKWNLFHLFHHRRLVAISVKDSSSTNDQEIDTKKSTQAISNIAANTAMLHSHVG